jgi:hypothetical protein
MIFQDLNNINLKNIPVIIFGSGPAGITTALELEKNKIQTLIIEAGDENYSDDSQDFYKGKITGDELTDISISRLRQLGGTSGHWGGWSKPMENYSFDSWPIKAKDLEGYTDRTCKILGIKNQFNKSKLNNYFNQIQFQYSNVRFAKKYKKHIKNSKYIHLVLNTQLSHFEGENKVVTNAVCISRNLTKKIQSKYFILSCGGIENSRILLWAREQNKKLFHKNLPIGQYWMNHPWIVAGIGLVIKRELKKKLNNNFIDYDGPLHFAAKKELLNDKKILSAAIYMNAKEDTKLVKEIVKDVLCVAPEYGKKIARMIFNKDLKCGNIFMNLEEPPNENNKITLDKKEKDLFEIPRVNLFYKQSNVSKITAKIFLEEFADLCRKEDFGRIALKKNVDEMQEFETLDNHHHLGGTRIGDNPNTSVVDKNLKVHFIKNLFVSGSSIFFTGGYTNPTYTIVQLSLRLADELYSKLNT